MANNFDVVKDWEERNIVSQLRDFMALRKSFRVASVNGLRRTGKTVAMFQLFRELPLEEAARTAYILVENGDMLNQLMRWIELLGNEGIKNFMIDEITKLDDFIDHASVFSDAYASRGFKIIISGTDSLGLVIASKKELFDRTVKVNSTWMSWREHKKLFGNSNMDDYLKNGGIMYGQNIKDVENDYEKFKEYFSTSILDNLQNSLDKYDNGSKYEELNRLRNNETLKHVVSKVVSDDNHRFILSVIKKYYKNYELRSGLFILGKDIQKNNLPVDIFDINIKAIEENVTKKLCINDDKFNNSVSQNEIDSIRNYLCLMDVFVKCPQAFGDRDNDRHLLVQPALRWHQTVELVNELGNDSAFLKLARENRDCVIKKVKELVLGKILEDNVIIDLMRSLPSRHRVFPCRFSTRESQGEFDIVIHDSEAGQYTAIKVKHTIQPCWEQAKHLRNTLFLSEASKFFGMPKRRIVLYSGISHMDFDNIIFMNVEEFLENLDNFETWIENLAKNLLLKKNMADRYIENFMSATITKNLFCDLVENYVDDDNKKPGMPFNAWLMENGHQTPSYCSLAANGIPDWRRRRQDKNLARLFKKHSWSDIQVKLLLEDSGKEFCLSLKNDFVEQTRKNPRREDKCGF